jgi:ferritin-like metal-binding protein YciE
LFGAEPSEENMDTGFSDKTREIFIIGLRNAHAMESEALGIMKPQLSRIESYPLVAARLDQHIRETEGQQQRLADLLDAMGESNSTVKDTALSIMGTMAAMGHALAGDEILKDSFANFAFENFEIAAYSSLLVLSEAGQFHQATQILQQNLAEEEAMAEWLRQNLAGVTRQFAGLREAGETAKI